MTAPAVQWVHQTPWEHEWIDFHGDRLAVKVPRGAALNVLQTAQSRHVSQQFRSKMTMLFAEQNVSVESRKRVMRRLIDPDDYPPGAFWELLNMVIKLGVEQLKAEKKPRQVRHQRRRRRG